MHILKIRSKVNLLQYSVSKSFWETYKLEINLIQYTFDYCMPEEGPSDLRGAPYLWEKQVRALSSINFLHPVILMSTAISHEFHTKQSCLRYVYALLFTDVLSMDIIT